MDGSVKQLIEDYFQVVWIEGRWDRVHEFAAPDFLNHGSFPGYPTSTMEDARRIEEAGRKAFPDIAYTLDKLVADGDMAARHWTATATHRGDFMGVPATGRHIFMQGMVFSRVESGRIKEEWRIVDSAGLMQQLTDTGGGAEVRQDSSEAIVAREYELQEAVQRQDREAIERLLRPEFRLSSGAALPAGITPRDEWVRIATGPFRQSSWRMQDPTVTIDGDTAVVTGVNEQEATYEGRPARSRFLTTDTWIRRAGDWQLLSRHVEAI